MSKKRILVIEDEKQIARFLELELTHEGYAVELSHDGREGLSKVEEWSPDLIILDVLLAGLNGMEVCRRIRQFSEVPVIMLTAKDQTMDKVMGLDLGANDYMTKPFDIEELLARIRSALRNTQTQEASTQLLELCDLSMDLSRHCVKKGTQAIDLTKYEYGLLEYLMRNQEIVLSRQQILENVWGYDYMGDSNIVDVYIRYLRKKIDESFDVKLIHTVRGAGYVMKVKLL